MNKKFLLVYEKHSIISYNFFVTFSSLLQMILLKVAVVVQGSYSLRLIFELIAHMVLNIQGKEYFIYIF